MSLARQLADSYIMIKGNLALAVVHAKTQKRHDEAMELLNNFNSFLRAQDEIFRAWTEEDESKKAEG